MPGGRGGRERMREGGERVIQSNMNVVLCSDSQSVASQVPALARSLTSLLRCGH